MFARIKKLFKQWRADRQHLRELLIKLDALTDPTFLDRALHGEWREKNGIHPNCKSVIRFTNGL